MVALILFTSFVLGFMWIRSEYEQFSRQSDEIRRDYLQSQKVLLSSEVQRPVDHIRFMTTRTESVLEENIRNRTEEALAIAWNIYEKFGRRLSVAETKRMIKEALRPIRYRDGKGYFFIVNLNGVEELYPVFPDFEGKDVTDLQDERGNYVIREEIQVVKEHGEGFVTGYWKKPGHENEEASPKISFVKLFEPFGWYIGTGEYLDDVQMAIQREALDFVSSLRFGPKGEKRLFVRSFEGEDLLNDIQAGGEDVCLWGDDPAWSEKVIREQIDAARQNPGGIFLEHHAPPSGGCGSSDRLAFVMAVPEWGWVVGAGVMTDEIEGLIAAGGDRLKEEVLRRFLQISVTVLFLILVALVMLRFVALRIRRQYSSFFSFFEKASVDYSEIDPESLRYREFAELAAAANKMIQERTRMENGIREMNDLLQGRVSDQSRKIEDLNQNIESRIEQRTKELKKLTETDGLTGLFNRRYVFEMLELLVEGTSVAGKNLSVIMLDLDDFKKLNDTYGHVFGDRVLEAVARTIQGCARSSDIAGRYGGEEFLVILPETGLEAAAKVADRIRQGVSKLKLDIPGLKLTISGGVAEFDGDSPTSLVERADKLLYKAKRGGKNRIER